MRLRVIKKLLSKIVPYIGAGMTGGLAFLIRSTALYYVWRWFIFKFNILPKLPLVAAMGCSFIISIITISLPGLDAHPMNKDTHGFNLWNSNQSLIVLKSLIILGLAYILHIMVK